MAAVVAGCGASLGEGETDCSGLEVGTVEAGGEVCPGWGEAAATTPTAVDAYDGPYD